MPTRAIPNLNTYKKTFQYRLRPTPSQLVQIEQAAGAVRFVYNWGTDIVRKASEKREPIPNFFVLARLLTPLKKEADKTWLNQAYNASLQNGLKDLDLSVKAFFREIKKKNRVGLPGFRKKGFNESIRYSSGIKNKNGKFYLPKIGLVDYYNSRPLEGKIKQAVVCKIIDKWFINVVCDVPIYHRSMPTSVSQPNASSMSLCEVDANNISTANYQNGNANLNEKVNLVLIDAKPQEDVNQRACTIHLGSGFLDKVLELDVDVVSPKRKKRAKGKKISKKVDVNLPNQLNENQVVMVKETRDSLRALCKKYKDVFMSIHEEPMFKGLPSNIERKSNESTEPINCYLSQATSLMPIESLPNKSKASQANRLLVRRQKKLSRSQKDSKNRIKARLVLEKQHLKIKRRRHDFLHKLSRYIVNQYDSITIKKYDLKKIMLSAYTPLAKVLRDKAWDKFIQYVQYKSAWYGKKFTIT